MKSEGNPPNKDTKEIHGHSTSSLVSIANNRVGAAGYRYWYGDRSHGPTLFIKVIVDPGRFQVWEKSVNLHSCYLTCWLYHGKSSRASL